MCRKTGKDSCRQTGNRNCRRTGHHMEKETAGRGGRIDLVGQTFEVDAALRQVVDDGHQVFHTAPQPVKLPHDQAVISPQRLQCQLQTAPGRIGAAGLVVIDFIATGLLKRGVLQAQVLVLSGYPSIADLHNLSVSRRLLKLITE